MASEEVKHPCMEKQTCWEKIERSPDETETEPNEKSASSGFGIWLRDCNEEMPEPMPGQTTGEIPLWLNGVLIRNGPGKLTYGESAFRHVFDSSSLLHRFHIKDGTPTYQYKFLDCEAYRKNMESQRIVFTEFGTRASADPCHSIFQRFASFFSSGEPSDNANISVYPMADELYAFGEYPTIHRIDPVTLETLKSVNVFKKVNIVHHTSHPHVTQDGTLYNVGLAVKGKPSYSVIEFPGAKKNASAKDRDVFSDAKIVAAVPSRWPLYPGYMHSFGLTDSYYIIIEQPFSLSVPSMWTMNLLQKAPFEMLKWFDNEPTLIHVVSRETGQSVGTFSSKTFFFFHTINQYEDEDYVVVDICIYKDPKIINQLLISVLKDPTDITFEKSIVAKAARFVLPLKRNPGAEIGENLVKLGDSNAKAWKLSGSDVINVSPEVLSIANCEMPRIKYPELLGKKYQYFYGIIMASDNTRPGGLVKVDTVKKNEQFWYEEGVIASEPVFIPSPQAEDEDDGVVVSSLLYTKGNENMAALLVLDGKTFKELGRTVFDTPCPVPYTFHGWFCDA